MSLSSFFCSGVRNGYAWGIVTVKESKREKKSKRSEMQLSNRGQIQHLCNILKNSMLTCYFLNWAETGRWKWDQGEDISRDEWICIMMVTTTVSIISTNVPHCVNLCMPSYTPFQHTSNMRLVLVLLLLLQTWFFSLIDYKRQLPVIEQGQCEIVLWFRHSRIECKNHGLYIDFKLI